MSNGTTGTEENAARLRAAREELDELLAEQRNLPRELEQAHRDDHEARVSSTGGIRAALSSMVSRVRGVEERREALPNEIWSASILALELEAEHAASLVEDLEEPKNEAHRAFTEADTELPKIQRRRQDLLDRTLVLTREQSAAERTKEEALRAVEQLHKTGPGHS